MSEQPAANVVQPSPSPMTWNVQIATGPDGSSVVVVQIAHSAGNFVSFLNSQDAQTIGGQLRAAGKRAVTGLFIPPGAVLPSDNGHEQDAP